MKRDAAYHQNTLQKSLVLQDPADTPTQCVTYTARKSDAKGESILPDLT